MVFSLMMPSVLLILLVLPVNIASARTFNNDFETGDLTDWEKDGVAFDFQPTWGDNPRSEEGEKTRTKSRCHAGR